MRFKNLDTVDLLPPAFLEMLNFTKARSPDVARYAKEMLYHMCRRLEIFVLPRASAKAQEKANELGIGDLSQYVWRDQPVRMADPGRTIFHLDHVEPVSQMKDKLLALDEPTLDQVREIISKTDIAWITKVENEKLNQLGYRSRRKNPIQCYREAGIALQEE